MVENREEFQKNDTNNMKSSSVNKLQTTETEPVEPLDTLFECRASHTNSAADLCNNKPFEADYFKSPADDAKLNFSKSCASVNLLVNNVHSPLFNESHENEFTLSTCNHSQIGACQDEYERFNRNGDSLRVGRIINYIPPPIQHMENQPESHIGENVQSVEKSQHENQKCPTTSLGTTVQIESEVTTPGQQQEYALFSIDPENNVKEKCNAFSTSQYGNTSQCLLIFKCDKCPKRFSRKLDLKRHTSVHSQQRGFVCQICEKWCHNLANFKRHQRTHTGERPFSCKYCSKCFSQTAILKRHIMIHTGEKPFECNVCGKKFNQKERLKVHSRQHTSGSDAICHKCQFCGKSFCYKSGLSRHLASHSGKTFSCSCCSKTFTDKSSMKRHLKQHFKEKHQ